MNQAHILVITNVLDVHADAVIRRLNDYRAHVHRINTEEFPEKINLCFKDIGDGISVYIEDENFNALDLKMLTSVWYRRPEPSTIIDQFSDQQIKRFVRDECQATLANLYALTECFWISPPLNIRKARHKLYQAKIARDLGFKVPKTLVTNIPNEVESFFNHCDGQVVIKSLSGSQLVYEKGDLAAAFGLFTTKITRDTLTKTDTVRLCPVFLQEYVPKKLEIRATVVGDRVFSAAIDSQSNPQAVDDWKRVDYKEIPHYPYTLPLNIERLCVKLVKVLGLAFGAIDLIITPENEIVFIEINPNGQWLWIEEETNQPISEAIAMLLINGNNL